MGIGLCRHESDWAALLRVLAVEGRRRLQEFIAGVSKQSVFSPWDLLVLLGTRVAKQSVEEILHCSHCRLAQALAVRPNTPGRSVRSYSLIAKGSPATPADAGCRI